MPPPFRALLGRPATPRPVRGRLAVLIAVPALALSLAVCSTLLVRPRPAPSVPGELSGLGELSGPLDFLLDPAAEDGLSGVPAFDLSSPSQEPLELTKGFRP